MMFELWAVSAIDKSAPTCRRVEQIKFGSTPSTAACHISPRPFRPFQIL